MAELCSAGQVRTPVPNHSAGPRELQRKLLVAGATQIQWLAMPPSGKLTLFFSAAVLLAIAPGPGMREGILSSLGTFAGGMVHVFAAAAGVSIILAKSALAFATVKYAGAAYLCFLGVRMILEARSQGDAPMVLTLRSRNPFWQGVATEVLNPKTALFFLSFIPQFVDHTRAHVFWQFVTLGTISVSLNTTADLVVTMFAGPLGNRIRSSVRFRRRQRALTGMIMICLGTYLATSDSNA